MRRPITPAHFPLFARMRAAGMDFCELLVPEGGRGGPGGLAGRGGARGWAGDLVLAARVNVHRDLASDERGIAAGGGVAYLRTLRRCRGGLRRPTWSAARFTARRWCSPDGPPRPFDTAQKGRARARGSSRGLRQGGAYAAKQGRACSPSSRSTASKRISATPAGRRCELADHGRQQGGRRHARHLSHEPGGKRPVWLRCVMRRHI